MRRCVVLAEHGISSSICAECRSRKAREGEPVPCETESGRCWVTKRAPDDEEAPMVSPWPVEYVIDLWERITEISIRQTVKKTTDKHIITYYLPTLEKMELILNEVDWQTAPLDRFTTIRLVGLYHNQYLSLKVSQ